MGMRLYHVFAIMGAAATAGAQQQVDVLVRGGTVVDGTGAPTRRAAGMGMSDRAPSPAQLDSMRKIVARGMDEGAIGMSTGLYYAPGSYSTTEEVIELAKVAAGKGGLYDSHIRDESSYTVGLIAA